jgi:hypothetical protein
VIEQGDKDGNLVLMDLIGKMSAVFSGWLMQANPTVALKLQSRNQLSL